MSTQDLSFVNLPTLLGDKTAEIDELFWQKLVELRVAIPAVVVSFDATTQTVTVQPTIQENVLRNGVSVPVNLPQIPMMLLGMMRFGGFNIVAQPAAGDEGMIVFADMCMDDWRQRGAPSISGNPSPSMPGQLETRRHDLSDGIFIPIGWSKPRLLTNFPSAGTLQISPDNSTTVSIQMTSTGITITASGSVSVSSSSEVVVSAPVVKLGDSSASEALAYLSSLESKFNSHTHSGVAAGGSDTLGPNTSFGSGDGTAKTVAD